MCLLFDLLFVCLLVCLFFCVCCCCLLLFVCWFLLVLLVFGVFWCVCCCFVVFLFCFFGVVFGGEHVWRVVVYMAFSVIVRFVYFKKKSILMFLHCACILIQYSIHSQLSPMLCTLF